MSTHPPVSSMVNASQRVLSRPKVKKDPLTLGMLQTLVTSMITDKSPSLSDLRSVTLCLISYVGFLRSCELCHIKACDVRFFPSYVSIFLESSKKDQFRDGSRTIIVRSNVPTCPVKALKDYITASQTDLSEDLPFLEPLLLLVQRREYRAVGLVTREPENLLKTLSGNSQTFPKLVSIALEL